VKKTGIIYSANNYLHLSEYPNDDFSHILEYNDPEHQLSKLQQITVARIAEVIRNKTPIDTVKILTVFCCKTLN
jgi:hypothetical protein